MLLNVLRVPGYDQDRNTVLNEFGGLVDDGASFVLPLGAVFETGNHIADIRDGQQRRRYATAFAEQVRQALRGEAPWTVAPWPDAAQLRRLLARFPDDATRGLGMVDLSIIEEWERACRRHRHLRVRIWALDRHLTGYDRTP
ncbi:MAG: hypothetical protein OXF93_23245 [Acidobacteria bacterium]|nr:hypothetical protein [Acidobacteriota bacterium]